MTISLKHLIATSLLVSAPTFAATCEMPEAPELPDGNEATMDEMISGQQAFKGFQSDAQAYRDCVDETMGEMKAAAEEGEETAVAKYAAAVEAYNGSVAAEEKLAAEFNAAIRAYKAAN